MKTRSTLAAALVLAVVAPIATAGTARADLPTSPPAQAAPDAWYGGAMLATDAASVALMAGSLYVHDHGGLDSWMAGVGAIGYGAGPLAFHLAHHNGRGAVMSVVTRTAVPVLGGLVGAVVTTCPTAQQDSFSFCPLGGALVGSIVGMGVAAVIDDVSLAYAPGEPAEPAPAPGLSFGAAPRPEGGFTVGLGGSF